MLGAVPKGGRSAYKKVDDTYVLDGRKCFITNSHIADIQIVLAYDADNPDAFTTFILETDMEGFKPTHKEHKVGMRGCNTGEIEMKEVVLTAENIIGVEGKGIIAKINVVERGGGDAVIESAGAGRFDGAGVGRG